MSGDLKHPVRRTQERRPDLLSKDESGKKRFKVKQEYLNKPRVGKSESIKTQSYERSNKIVEAEYSEARGKFPVFKAGDTINVHVRIKEGNKERIQQFQGTVIQRRKPKL